MLTLDVFTSMLNSVGMARGNPDVFRAKRDFEFFVFFYGSQLHAAGSLSLLSSAAVFNKKLPMHPLSSKRDAFSTSTWWSS